MKKQYVSFQCNGTCTSFRDPDRGGEPCLIQITFTDPDDPDYNYKHYNEYAEHSLKCIQGFTRGEMVWTCIGIIQDKE